jgi:hypothetical protein
LQRLKDDAYRRARADVIKEVGDLLKGLEGKSSGTGNRSSNRSKGPSMTKPGSKVHRLVQFIRKTVHRLKSIGVLSERNGKLWATTIAARRKPQPGNEPQEASHLAAAHPFPA